MRPDCRHGGCGWAPPNWQSASTVLMQQFVQPSAVGCRASLRQRPARLRCRRDRDGWFVHTDAAGTPVLVDFARTTKSAVAESEVDESLPVHDESALAPPAQRAPIDLDSQAWFGRDV